MANPYIHSKSSAKKWGGKWEDYISIHEFMDSTKAAYPNNAHRAILHTSFACSSIIPRVFGTVITNSDGREISTKDIAELHVLEDNRMRFIPTIQDYLENIELKPWMNGGLGEGPPSARPVENISKQDLKNFSAD